MTTNAERQASKLFKETRDREELRLKETMKGYDDLLERRAAQVEGLCEMMPTATAYLAVTATLSKEGRAAMLEWQTSVNQMGYAGLTCACYRAMITHNSPEGMALAAACCERLWALRDSGKKTPITPQQLATRIVGPRHQKLLLLRSEIQNMRDNLTQLRRRVLTGKASGADQIARGLRQRALDKQRKAFGN